MKNKFLTLALLISLGNVCAAAGIKDIGSVKEPAYRLGVSDEIEEKLILVNPIETSNVKGNEASDVESLTYADLSIKKISAQISDELQIEYDEMLEDLSLLWRGAATRSDIIKFALYKLSNPEADKPNEKSVKKVLQSIASMSTMVGAGMGNPILSSTSFLGGNVLGIMSQDDKAANYKFTKVNDADMIILVRKIDELQQEVVNLYYDYITTKRMLDLTTKMAKQRHTNYQLAQGSSREIVLITDAYYRESIDMQVKSRSDFYAKRAALEQLVGNETFVQFEEILKMRDSKAQN